MTHLSGARISRRSPWLQFVATLILTITLSGSIALNGANASEVGEEISVLHVGALLAVPGGNVEHNKTIVIRGELIDEIRDGFVDPGAIDSNANLVDLSNHFVLPGLMDMHVHLLSQITLGSESERLTTTASAEALSGAHYARATLAAGFTTVRDVGGTPEAIFALRQSINNGETLGPRIFAAGGYLSPTGGHGDVVGFSPELMALWLEDTICDGPYECRKATRQAIKLGADWIKITATGGVLSDVATGTDQQLRDDELIEIVSTAHDLGRKVTAHAHGVAGIIAALEAGVDSIEHGTFIDKEAIRLFKKQNTYLVPTLLPSVKVLEMMENNPYFTLAIKEKVRSVAGPASENLNRAYRAGVKIAFGTDTGVTPHGLNAQEFSLLVKAGMSPNDAIRAATVAAADLLGVSDELGVIEVGKRADIVAVIGDPLDDISVLEHVDVVFKDGELLKFESQGLILQ